MTESMTAATAVVPDDFTALVDLTDVRLSPDGQEFLVATKVPDVAVNGYRRQVLRGRVGGTEAPVPVVDLPGVRMPRWCPDGSGCAVVVDAAEGCSILLQDNNSIRPLVENWPDSIEELSWSPDGRHLLFVVREPQDRQYWALPDDRRPPLRLTSLRYRDDAIEWTVGRPLQAYLVPLAGAPRKLSTPAASDSEFSWHPDGQSVFFVSQRQSDADRSPLNDVYQQPLDGQARQLTDTSRCFGAPIASPDGRYLVATSVDVTGYPATTGLVRIDLASGERTDLTAAIDRDCRAAIFPSATDSAASVLVLVDDTGATHLRQVPTEPGSSAEQAVLDGQVLDGPVLDGPVLDGPLRVAAFDQAGDVLAAVVASPTEPSYLVVRQASGDQAVRFSPNASWRDSRTLARPVHTATPVAEGVTVDSWLFTPAVADSKIPLVVWLQGGGSQNGYQFSHEIQMLVGAGYAVVFLNARGSAGYGTDWMRTVCGVRSKSPGTGWGTVDIADVAAVVRETLAKNAHLDPSRVGVMGGSYGALVTTHLLAQTDLFAAGWAERGPYNLISDAGTKDEAPWFFQAYLGASHLTDAESYWQASPLRLVEGMTAPLAIVHSELDRRCSIGQAEELFMALKLLDRTVELIRFPGECHELTRSGRPVHLLQRAEILLEWFGRWLQPS